MRWKEHMASDKFRKEHWRKSSQWSMYIRPHAQLVAEDEYVWSRVKRGCYAVNETSGTECAPPCTFLARWVLGWLFDNVNSVS